MCYNVLHHFRDLWNNSGIQAKLSGRTQQIGLINITLRTTDKIRVGGEFLTRVASPEHGMIGTPMVSNMIQVDKVIKGNVAPGKTLNVVTEENLSGEIIMGDMVALEKQEGYSIPIQSTNIRAWGRTEY
jgi:hypothetical protein